MLVAYSDSEGSDTEALPNDTRTASRPATQHNFAVDKSNPKKIRVNLSQPPQVLDAEDEQPPAKRPRVGAGAFSGFNAMLPPPKRTNEAQTSSSLGPKSASRKVFSLKTGAEPAFDRESDAEMKTIFATQENAGDGLDLPPVTHDSVPAFISSKEEPVQIQGKPLMFKPLSVARSSKKKAKKAFGQISSASANESLNASNSPSTTRPTEPAAKPLPINIFSSGPSNIPAESFEEEDEIVQVLDDETETSPVQSDMMPETGATMESLGAIADGLNLSAAERRQLFGRGVKDTGKVITFNTDAEYAANQAHIAAGEQVQHNPVRAIAPGKHSLKSLVASAAGQQEALEESFAAGRKNKREAGSKYGW